MDDKSVEAINKEAVDLVRRHLNTCLTKPGIFSSLACRHVISFCVRGKPSLSLSLSWCVDGVFTSIPGHNLVDFGFFKSNTYSAFITVIYIHTYTGSATQRPSFFF